MTRTPKLEDEEKKVTALILGDEELRASAPCPPSLEANGGRASPAPVWAQGSFKDAPTQPG